MNSLTVNYDANLMSPHCLNYGEWAVVATRIPPPPLTYVHTYMQHVSQLPSFNCSTRNPLKLRHSQVLNELVSIKDRCQVDCKIQTAVVFTDT